MIFMHFKSITTTTLWPINTSCIITSNDYNDNFKLNVQKLKIYLKHKQST